MSLQFITLLATATQGRLFNLDQQTLITIGIQLLNVGLLVGALAFIVFCLYKLVRKILQRRADGFIDKKAEAISSIAPCEQNLDEIERAHATKL